MAATWGVIVIFLLDQNLCFLIKGSLLKTSKDAKKLGFASPGRSARGVDKDWKDSEDVTFACLPVDLYASTVQLYREHLMQCLNEYMREFPILQSATGKLGFLEPPQIQRYSPGAAFFGEHYELFSMSFHKTFNCIIKQTCDGHRTNTTWHWRNRLRHFGNFIKINVTY